MIKEESGIAGQQQFRRRRLVGWRAVSARALAWAARSTALAALAIGLLACVGVSPALAAHHRSRSAFAPNAALRALNTGATNSRQARAASRARPAVEPVTCLVHSLPAFIDQGEFEEHSSVADVIEVECDAVFAEQKIEISAHELASRCKVDWLHGHSPVSIEEGPSVKGVELDDAGNAQVALIAGPSCAAGEVLISAHLEAPPYTTVTTAFTVLSPRNTPEGVFMKEPAQIEDDFDSSLFTIVQVEFPSVYAEQEVEVAAEQLFSRCLVAPKLVWFTPGTKLKRTEGVESFRLKLDNNGNAFAVIAAEESCASGSSLIEASLVKAPYTTLTTEFTVESPRETVEELPGFTIEKKQQIAGSGKPFTTSTLIGEIGQTVNYEITVTNTGNVPLNLTGFMDANCESIAGGPTHALAPNASTTYTCKHVLTSVGTWINEASVTGIPPSGVPIPHMSNKVIVEVPPSPGFTLEKKQRIEGSGLPFTKEKLAGKLGETVEYEITVENTGNVPLKFGSFSDPHCEEVTGGPGGNPVPPHGTTTYMCRHVLTELGVWVNVATVTGTPEGGMPKSKESNKVEVEVKAQNMPAFVIRKLQRIKGSGGSFTEATLEAEPFATVEYEIIVTNTGNVPLKFENFTDPECAPGTIAGGPGAEAIASGKSTTYTCSRMVKGEGRYPNVASVVGKPEGMAPIPKESNKVEVVVAETKTPREEVTKLKEQRIKGSGAPFTTEKVTAKLGETVEYEITFTNTGNIPVKLSEFSDPRCDPGTVSGPAEPLLEPGQSASYRCSHLVTSVGAYPNEAEITVTPKGGTPTKEKTNLVEAVTPPEPGMTVEKLERIAGSKEYVRGPLSGKVGETVEYLVIVTNTGNEELALSFSDPICDPGTLSGPKGTLNAKGNLAAGTSVTYECSHVLKEGGPNPLVNTATVTGTPPSGPPITVPSSVSVGVAKQAVKCAVLLSAWALKGATGPKRKPFKVQVNARGIKRITFYLGKHKLKTLTQRQAKKGKFTITIDPASLSIGSHRLTATIIPSEAACKKASVSSVFVHNLSKRQPPPFTG